MYYTAILEHDQANGSSYRMSLRVPSSKTLQLKSVVPGFFNNQDNQSGGVHVLILCADEKDLWTDFRLRAEFTNPDALHTQTPQSPSTTQASYCFLLDNNISSIYDVITEIAQKVKCCFGDDYALEALAASLAIIPVDKTIIWSAEQAEKFSRLLSDGINQAKETLNCQHTLYLLVLMPKNHFSDFEVLNLPLFIDYVVQGQSEDPDMENLRRDLEQKSQALEEEKRENMELLMALKQISEVVQEIQRDIDEMIIKIQNFENQYDPLDIFFVQVKEDIKAQLVVLQQKYIVLQENYDEVERKHKNRQLKK